MDRSLSDLVQFLLGNFYFRLLDTFFAPFSRNGLCSLFSTNQSPGDYLSAVIVGDWSFDHFRPYKTYIKSGAPNNLLSLHIKPSAEVKYY